MKLKYFVHYTNTTKEILLTVENSEPENNCFVAASHSTIIPRGYVSYEFYFSRGDMYNLAYIGAKNLNCLF